ncbi:hypothetical protein TacPo2_78 [Pantoea bacteriophage TacPo2]
MSITINDIIRDAAGINSLADTIMAEGKKLDGMIHLALASATVLAHEHGDITVLNRVISKLSAGIRSNAARAFAETFAPVTFDKKAKEFRFNKNKRNEAFIDSEAAKEMCETVWTKFRPEPEYKPMNLADSFTKLIDRAQSDMEKNDSISEAQIALLRGFQEQLAALQAKEATEKASAAAEAAIAETPAEAEAVAA